MVIASFAHVAKGHRRAGWVSWGLAATDQALYAASIRALEIAAQ